MKRASAAHTRLRSQRRARVRVPHARVCVCMYMCVCICVCVCTYMFDSEAEWQREGWKWGIAREPVRQGGNRREKKGEFSRGTSPGDWHTPQNRTNPESSPNLTCRPVQPDPRYPWHHHLRKEVNLRESRSERTRPLQPTRRHPFSSLASRHSRSQSRPVAVITKMYSRWDGRSHRPRREKSILIAFYAPLYEDVRSPKFAPTCERHETSSTICLT